MKGPLPFSRFFAYSRKSVIVLLLLLSQFAFSNYFFADAAAPQLVVTKVDEFCDGGGSITCSISDATPGATVEFRVYLLPNTATPIAVITTNGGQLTGLDAANYQIVATQTLNGVATALPPQTVAIENHIEPLDFDVAHTDEHCNDGSMTVSVTSGYAVAYALFSGPVTAPAQASNYFGNLPAGLYIVHAIDACGTVKAHSYTVPHNDCPFTVGPMGFNPQLPACNQINVTHSVIIGDSENDDLLYPLTFTYTVHPPAGAPSQVFTFVETSGSGDLFMGSHIIPFWYDELYFYDVTVIDKCGQAVSLSNIPVNLHLTASLDPQVGDCGQFFFSITPSVYVPPYTIVFTDAPAGFDPTAFNPDHPGPFSGGETIYGDAQNTVPFGHYAATLTDACGHSANIEQDIEPNELPPTFIPVPHPGCAATLSDLQIQTISFDIDHVVVTSGPPEFGPYPYNVPPENQTDEQEIWIYDLPAGTYHIIIYDTCGIAHEYDETIHDINFNNEPSFTTRADCELGFGGVRIRGGNSTTLTSVVITAAPPEFTEALPYDASLFIGSGNGIFTMAHLPPGMYSFLLTDNCGTVHNSDFEVMKYEQDAANTVTVDKHCSAFDVYLSHVSNATAATFWLQELNETTGQWFHPITGAAYTENTPITATYAIALTNNFNNINQLFLGHFRVIKMFQAYENGNIAPTKNCYETLLEFDNTGEVSIVDIIKLTCDGETSNVKVVADGVPPFHYKIIEKDGQPFVIDNGNNDTFTNLEPAVYKFSVEHFCGQVVTKIVDIANLPSQIAAVQPTSPLIACDEDDNDGMADFDLTSFDATIIGSQNASDFTITYHATASDAASGDNALAMPYYSATATLFARLKVNSGDCYDVVTVDVIVNPYPLLLMQLRYALCPSDSRTITADAGMDSYLWSTGDTTPSITVSQPGTYTLTVTQGNNGITCSGVYQIEVFALVPPTISSIETQDWTDHDNAIVVHTNEPDTGDFLYSIDGGATFQSSNTFNGLSPGTYHIMVKDLGDCGHEDADAYLLMFPRFFTPNGDSYNDYWKVKFDELEPNLETFIFDRYGKLITGFPSGGSWDGTYNGKQLPSTDYWFVVRRQDGRELKGHFAMKR